MRNDIMIDIETLGTKPNSVILTIGAIRFSRSYTDNIVPNIDELKTFYRKIDFQSCVDVGLQHDQKTVDWWLEQTTEAKREAFKGERIALRQSLVEFSTWVFQTPKNTNIIWSNGPSFDISILDNAFYACGLFPPWLYFNVRDCRTIYDITNITNLDMGQTDHTAVSDCHRQIVGLVKGFSRIAPVVQATIVGENIPSN